MSASIAFFFVFAAATPTGTSPVFPSASFSSNSATPVEPTGASASVHGALVQPQGAPVQEEGEFYILNFDETGSAGVSLLDFVKICQEATGINFMFTPETENQFLKTRTVRIFGTKRIPKEDFYAFFQIVLFINDLICTKVGPEPLSIVVVQPLAPGGQRSNLRSEAIYVLPEELDKYADQVATLITTVIHLPNTDVRQLGTSLRTLFTDQATQSAIPLGNTNSFILQGFASNIVALARMLQIVDRESAIDQDILPTFEVIPLEYAAAEDVADVLEQLLEASTRVAQQNRQTLQAQGVTGPIQGLGSEAKILTYPRTNSLLIMALPDDLENIKELVARLDVDVVEPERNYHVYAVNNVQAEELVEVLEDFLQDASRVDLTGAARPQGQPGQAPTGGGGGGRRSGNSDVVTVADPVSNTVLIAANKTRYEEILDLLRRLDQRQEQVLIETALIELTGRGSLDLGVELGFADLPGASETGGFGVTSFGLSTLIDSDNDGVLDSRIPNSGLGVAAGILDGDDFNLPVLLRAIEDRRNTNVLNVPSVLVNNNGTAEVKSIDSQPTTQITATGGGVAGQTQENFAGYQDAGITLMISPSISAAGYLRLDVYLEVATFLGQFSGSIPAPKITRTIETSVNVPDGDTMVIGGIVTDNRDEARTQVPWLGDLPVVGRLFRRDTESNNRTTLYFFVTPHILRDIDFADLSEISYRVKLNAADKIGADRLRIIDPHFQGPGESVELEGFQIPLYRSPASGEVSAESVGLDDPLRRHELLGTKPPIGESAPIDESPSAVESPPIDGASPVNGVPPGDDTPSGDNAPTTGGTGAEDPLVPDPPKGGGNSGASGEGLPQGGH